MDHRHHPGVVECKYPERFSWPTHDDRDLRTYLEQLLKWTNMRCLTPATAFSGECDFLSCNLYAKSIFGEDAIANLSIENVNGKVTGHIRIRAKGQGIALSLGDKVNSHVYLTLECGDKWQRCAVLSAGHTRPQLLIMDPLLHFFCVCFPLLTLFFVDFFINYGQRQLIRKSTA